MNTRRPRSRPDLVRFMEDISMPILERPLPDPVEDCYREQMKTKILLDQEDIELVKNQIFERRKTTTNPSLGIGIRSISCETFSRNARIE